MNDIFLYFEVKEKGYDTYQLFAITLRRTGSGSGEFGCVCWWGVCTLTHPFCWTLSRTLTRLTGGRRYTQTTVFTFKTKTGNSRFTSRFSKNSEAFAFEFIEYLEELFLFHHNHCLDISIDHSFVDILCDKLCY